MSVSAYKWALSFTDGLTTSEKFVLVMLAEHFNEEQLRAWPAISTLAGLTCSSESTVRRALRGLVEKRFVEVEQWFNVAKGSQMSNRYALPMYDSRSTAERRMVRVVAEWGPEGKWVVERVK